VTQPDTAPAFSRATFTLGPLDGEAGSMLGSRDRLCVRHGIALALDDPEAQDRLDALPDGACVIYARSGPPAAEATYVHQPDDDHGDGTCYHAKRVAQHEAAIEGQRAARGDKRRK